MPDPSPVGLTRKEARTALEAVMFDYGHDQPAASVSMMEAALRAAYRIDSGVE